MRRARLASSVLSLAIAAAGCAIGSTTIGGSQGGGGSTGGTGNPFAGGGGGGNPFGGGGSGQDGGGGTIDSGTSGGPMDTGTPTATMDSGAPPAQDSGSPAPPDSGTNDGFDQFQHHNLDVINMYRAMMSLPPYVLDQQLSAFALAGSQELSMDHMPHQHFITASNDGTLWTSGFMGSAGENQGDPNGWPPASSDPVQNELTQIDQIQQAMFAEGPGGGHYDNIMSPTFTRLGVGLLEVGDVLYLTNDFSQ